MRVPVPFLGHGARLDAPPALGVWELGVREVFCNNSNISRCDVGFLYERSLVIPPSDRGPVLVEPSDIGADEIE